jgi:hypothetical protein
MRPGEDPVDVALWRYRRRFPEAQSHDPVTNQLFEMLRRSLVQADIAMQDEGLNPDARRRVITCALYGSLDGERQAEGRAVRGQRIDTVAMVTSLYATCVPHRPFGPIDFCLQCREALDQQHQHEPHQHPHPTCPRCNPEEDGLFRDAEFPANPSIEEIIHRVTNDAHNGYSTSDVTNRWAIAQLQQRRNPE